MSDVRRLRSSGLPKILTSVTGKPTTQTACRGYRLVTLLRRESAEHPNLHTTDRALSQAAAA